MNMGEVFLAIKEGLSENSTMALTGDIVRYPISASVPPLINTFSPGRPSVAAQYWTA